MQGTREDAILQRYFGDSRKWGANIIFDEYGKIDICEICRLSDVTIDGATWTHYANILCMLRDKNWEVNEQFKGEREDEMWIYGQYTTFARAVRNLATRGTSEQKRKPIEIYH
jgi:hypothetical protein